MNKHDHAVLIGINKYPNMKRGDWLEYAVSDVEKFKLWLISPTGGRLAPGNVTTICANANEVTKLNPKPTESDFQRHIVGFLQRSAGLMEKDPAEVDPDEYYIEDGQVYIGRRIYLYFSGHGIAHTINKTDNALLSADGDYEFQITNHINGWKYLEYLEASGIFKEVVLLMDCCRTVARDSGIMNMRPPFEPRVATYPRSVRTMRAYSSEYTRKSFERDEYGGGVFTELLVQVLNHAPTREGSDQITFEQFRDYFKVRTEDLKQKPIIACGPGSEGLVLNVKPPSEDTDGPVDESGQRPIVTFVFPDRLIGKQLIMKDHNLQIIEDLRNLIDAKELPLALDPGLYAFEIEGENIQGIINVTKNETKHVGE